MNSCLLGSGFYGRVVGCLWQEGEFRWARAAFDAEGRILALEDIFYLDQGAYVRTHGARVAEMTMAMVPGPYRIPAYRSVCHFRPTNKTPAATYRAPGRYEGTFVRERLIDAIADRLGLDRVTARRRNLVTASEMPFCRKLNALGTEIVYDSGDYPRLLESALFALLFLKARPAAAPVPA